MSSGRSRWRIGWQEKSRNWQGHSYQIMEVCGGHTHTIKHGLEDYLPENVSLVHGPGCPVWIPMGRLDDAIFIAEQPGVIFTSFGDMMRVPGSRGSFLDAKVRGADNPDRLLATRSAQYRAAQSRQAGGVFCDRI